MFFRHFHRRFEGWIERERRRHRERTPGNAPTGADAAGPDWDWHHEWEKFHRKAEGRRRAWERKAAHKWNRHVVDPTVKRSKHESRDAGAEEVDEEAKRMKRARSRARVEVGFYAHLMSYAGTIGFLALINLMTTWYPWFLWPALGWGIGLFSHYMAVFGTRMLRVRFFDPAVDREVRREKSVMQTEQQASLDELSSTIAHEIRNPIAAAKSLVQQMGEDPTSGENVEYANVALDELDRVERRISHLLRFAREEDYEFDRVNLASVVDSALTQMRGKLDTARVQIARNYIGGPTVQADREKLQQVFANVLDNAIDAFDGVHEGRRIDLFIENDGAGAVVRLRDNGCGIPAAKIDRIFHPFFTTKEKGTGLGMAISKKIVEAHDGTIGVVSEPGRGSEFAITLPRPQ